MLLVAARVLVAGGSGLSRRVGRARPGDPHAGSRQQWCPTQPPGVLSPRSHAARARSFGPIAGRRQCWRPHRGQ